jgi:hypothetical protein
MVVDTHDYPLAEIRQRAIDLLTIELERMLLILSPF